MYVSGVTVAPIFNKIDFEDNWVRTFRKDKPKIAPEELKMLKDWNENGQFQEMLVYLGEGFMGLDEEMAEFCFREVLRGNI